VNTLILLVIFITIVAILGALVYWMYSKYDNLRKALSKDLVDLIESGGKDGLLAFDIHHQDIDFKFIPTIHREKGFYYIKLGEGEDEKNHIKVKKSEIYFLRGKHPSIFLINDKIRAANVELLKSLDVLSPHVRSRILNDWSKYTSLKERIDEINDDLVFTRDEAKRKQLEAELEKLQKELEEINESYRLLFEEIDKHGAVAFNKGDKIVIIRPFDFTKLVDFMTGVHGDEIRETARSMYLRKVEHLLKDISRKVGIEMEEQKQGGFSWTTILLGVLFFGGIGLILLGVILRALGGG